MTVIGLYHPGRSVLHRVSAGWKLLGMLLAITGVILLTTPWQLAVAAVLITAPDVLVADEPTTLLDLRNARMVNDLLTRLTQQVVLVTHHLALLTGFDRVVVLDAGRVVADGNPAAALAAYTGLLA